MPDKQNAEMQLVQSELMKRFNQLQSALDACTDYEQAQGILREMQEVNHRVTLAGSVLFAAQSAALTAKADEVRRASNRAAKALREAKLTKDIMDAITGFLGVVDEAIDLAKTL